MLFRFGTMRGPGFVQPSWAFEQMMDELAHAANMDPIAFRAAHVSNPRWATTYRRRADGELEAEGRRLQPLR